VGAASQAGSATRLDGVPFSFSESLSGCFARAPSAQYPPQAASDLFDSRIRIDVRIGIPDLGRFLRDPRHPGALSGTLFLPCLGGRFPVDAGRFEMFTVDPGTGRLQIEYEFGFTAADGQPYCFLGRKNLFHRAWRFDGVRDMTRLVATVHSGVDRTGPVVGTGQLRFRLLDARRWLASMQVSGTSSWRRRAAARAAFLSLGEGALRDEYAGGVRPFYDASYENLVVSGTARREHRPDAASFCLVSGVHAKGFPWGDGELFSDVLLVMKTGANTYQRYCITDRVLRGLDLDLARGTCTYRGPLVAMDAGWAASFGDLTGPADVLRRLQAEIDVRFEARACQTVPLPFPHTSPLLRRVRSGLNGWLFRSLPGTHLPGIHVTPYAITVTSGSIRIRADGEPEGSDDWVILPAEAFGEGERGSFRNLKRPKLAYRYSCVVNASSREASVGIRASTIRQRRVRGALLDRLVSRAFSTSYVVSNEGATISEDVPTTRRRRDCAATRPLPVLEVSHGQFPTAVFLRRIVEADGGSGGCLSLEEDMSPVRGGQQEAPRTAIVASICDEDKRMALERVLDATRFDALVEEALVTSRKARDAFSVVIKPNFMFAYDRRDRSTFTDPDLVAHLVARLRGRGFRHITVAEAQSSYGEYFDRRSVKEMAEYLGYDGRAGYEVVDMTLDADERRDLGQVLGVHPVSRAWRDADFRISFAKNKTHPYAYYTLTIKNIFGALPPRDKFREYHCGRGIYATAVEYLAAFPVHFGLIDAHVSADGAFGAFANPRPNRTATVLGGSDLVAVDWVGASRMGLDPMVSGHMQLAVRRFGLPRIRVIGESTWYTPWRNVPRIMTLLTNGLMDTSYPVGRFLYEVSAQMDEDRFQAANRAWYMRGCRLLTLPVRRALFVRHPRRPRPGAGARSLSA